jgi:hypothetical protein
MMRAVMKARQTFVTLSASEIIQVTLKGLHKCVVVSKYDLLVRSETANTEEYILLELAERQTVLDL